MIEPIKVEVASSTNENARWISARRTPLLIRLRKRLAMLQ